MTPQLPDTWAAASILDLHDRTGLDIENVSAEIFRCYEPLLRLALEAVEVGGLRNNRDARTALRIALRMETR